MGTSAPHTTDTITALARGGYAARGIVYLLVGGLATMAALGRGGQTSGSRDALQTLLGAPAGDALLVLLALGLLGYALWRFIQAVKDPDAHGTDARGVAIRTGFVVSAVIHVLLAIFAIRLVFTLGQSSGSSGSGGGNEGITRWLMQQPYGRYLVAAVGIAVLGAGIAHIVKGLKAKFDKYMSMPPDTRRWAYPVCRFGPVIRGVVMLIVGAFFLVAAYQIDPSEAGWLGEVFSTVRQQMYGRILLGIVAIGLFAFGVYGLLEARYRRVDAPG